MKIPNIELLHAIPTKWKGSITILIIFLISACKPAAPAAPGQTAESNSETKDLSEEKIDKKVILFYGNSLTAGYGLEEEESFPSRIEDKIDSLGLPYTVVNAGLSGETTSGGLKRIDWVMKQKVDIFFLELGANDMLRGLPIEETRKNLAQIIAEVKEKNPEVKIGLCEMMAPPNMGDEYVKAFNQIYKDLAKSNDITFVPFFLEGIAGQEEFMLQDGKHPNAKGQKIVADNIWNSLQGML
jgi:acyl-CoA thioesterase-1